MEITVKVTVDPELQLLLTRGVKALEALTVPVPFSVPESKEAPKPISFTAAEPAPVEAAPAPEAPAQETISSQDLQQKVVLLMSQKPALKAQIRDIVKEYAEKISAIPADKRGEVWDRISALTEG